jgi:hypothetical protein
VNAESIEDVLAEFLEVRERAGGSERYRELISRLDEYFWKRCEEAVVRALPEEEGEELSLGAAEKLLLDAGLLDVALVRRARRDFLEQLGAELSSSGPDGVCYLAEWLSQRLHAFLAERSLPGEPAAASALLRATGGEDAGLVRAREQRNELYRRVTGLLEGLPGVNPDLAGAIVRGAVDDRVEELLLARALQGDPAAGDEAEAGDPAGAQAKRYDRVVQRVLRQARERSSSDEEIRCLELIAKLRMAVFRKSVAHARRAGRGGELGEGGGGAAGGAVGSRPAREATRSETEEFVRRELRLLRSLLRIGSREGQVDFACSVLLHDVARTTKQIVGQVLDMVREVDPAIGLSHDVLIAPFTGSGFFEWDRNTLIVALTPARGSEEAVANAVANFRLLDDASGRGTLTSAYREMYGPDFREQFLADYRSWVLRTGRGRRDAMNERSFRFFAEHVGPPPSGPLVPHEMGRLSVEERQKEINRLNRVVRSGEYSPEEAYRLAVLLWQSERIADAIRNMEKAAQAAPGDGRTLYALGVLCRKKHLTGTARRAFHQTVRVAPDSLWCLYASEALRRLV